MSKFWLSWYVLPMSVKIRSFAGPTDRNVYSKFRTKYLFPPRMRPNWSVNT
jgi:hypothetical protein